MRTPHRIPELLAPAGDRASLEAAVRNGADAVYLGARSFSARARAGNFDPDSLRAAVDFARLHGVRPYLALNTLLHDEELDEAVELAAQAYEAGIEATIVQDLGLARRLRTALPDLPLHASTQATVFDETALRAAHALGFTRIILPRELSVDEIADLSRVASEIGAETEVFVHGALCFCYSGQCRMSSLIGGRSGNRGECAQPCRLAYSLEWKGSAATTPAPKPLLSPRDLSALPLLPDLVASGTTALKIEGRMRSAEYVGQVVGVFRRRLDALAERGPVDGRATPAEADEDLRRLLLAFNRGGSFTDDYLRDAKGPAMMAGSYAGSHGVRLGRIHRVAPGQGVLEIRLEPPDVAAPGPGDVLSVRDPETGEERASAPCSPSPAMSGGPGVRILPVKGFHPDVLRTFHEGDPVHRMNDVAAEREARAAERRRTPVEAVFSRDGASGCLRLDVRVADGPSASLSASATEETPRDGTVPPLDETRLREQLARMGGTPFRLDGLLVLAPPTLPVSAVNALRRTALERLSDALVASFHRVRPLAEPPVRPDGEAPAASSVPAVLAVPVAVPTTWTVAVEPSTFDGNAEDAACGADAYYLPAVAWLSPEGLARIRRLHALEPHAALFAALPPAARGDFARRLARLPALVAAEGGQGVVTGSPGTVAAASTLGLSPVAGPDANLWNAPALAVFRAFGATVATPSPELDPAHVAALCRSAAAAGLDPEPVVYGRQRLMFDELCPVGLNRPGCTLCSRGPVALRDRTGVSFPVVCLPECCSAAILNASVLSIPREALAFRDAGATRLRLCFHDETPAERRQLVEQHRRLSDSEGAERVRATAAAVALRMGTRLTRGPQ